MGIAFSTPLLVIGISMVAPALAVAQDSPAIVIVVGHRSSVQAVTRDELREMYLKRRRIWPSGSPAVPVNLPAQDPVRIAFSLRVLGRRPEQLMTHWDRQYFEGITPPVVLHSGASVCEYVAAEPNAIGYLPLNEASESCRVILTLDP